MAEYWNAGAVEWWKFGQGAFDEASKSKSGSLSKSKGHRMALGYEKPEGYRLARSATSRGFTRVRESEEAHAAKTERVDPDPDSDSDLDKTKPQQGCGGDGIPPPHR